MNDYIFSWVIFDFSLKQFLQELHFNVQIMDSIWLFKLEISPKSRSLSFRSKFTYLAEKQLC